MFDVIVVGGGIAGCSSAISLALNGKKVLLLEKGNYPSHKICGEFLSVEAADILERLGALAPTQQAGACPISEVLVTASSGRQWRGKLPGIAYGISRYSFDQILFNRSLQAGVEGRTQTNVLNVTGSLLEGFVVTTAVQEFRGRTVIGAYGKRSALSDAITQRRSDDSEEYVGFKQHFKGPGPDGVVEVHAFDRGYCGINKVENGTVNVCWLARRSLLTEFGGSHTAIIDQVMPGNAALYARLSSLMPIEGTFCAIGGVSLRRKETVVKDVFLAGDSAQMIAPFCGDGMGMALRTGEMTAELYLQYLDNKISELDLIEKYRTCWNREFNTRLALGRILQNIALSPKGADAALALLRWAPGVGQMLIAGTRGTSGAASESSSRHPSIVSPGPKASATPRP